MTAARWSRISAIYNAAVTRTGAQRAAYLSKACGADEGVRREVESLLAQGESFLGTAVKLPADARLGPYEIVSIIGAGGMGVVYRARDTRLQRDVALKVLPEAFALDPDRVARFRREAQLLAALNHPHIAAIHGFEEADGVHALVLELVDGPTLADQIARGPISLDEALPIARQIAEALEAAHEQGIIHRDLKPANIKVRDDGTVKVLDFGLAKLIEKGSGIGGQGSGGAEAASMSPTITSPAMMTGVGVLLGTAAYMSPEQAKGKPADKRSDIWAFGCVLYEMLTGRRPFEATDVVEALACALTKEPEWTALPGETPDRIRELLRRCLAKSRRDRLADAADVRLELVSAIDERAKPRLHATRGARVFGRWAAWTTAIGLAVVTGAAGAMFGARFASQERASGDVYRASLPLVSNAGNPISGLGGGFLTVERVMALSPDGRRLAFVAASQSAGTVIWVRQLDSGAASPVAGTENGNSPFWSPDSRVLGFFADGAVKKVDLRGGPPVTLVSDVGLGEGATWSRGDVILYSDGQSLFRVPATGGTPVVVARSPTEDSENYSWPYFLPDGEHFLYRGPGFQTYVRGLANDAAPKRVGAGSNTQYANNSLVFARGTVLLAQPFDVSGLEPVGEPTPIGDQIRSGIAGSASGLFSVSQNGVVVYETGTALTQLTWFARTGASNGVIDQVATHQTMALSPDGRKLVYGRRAAGGGATNQSLWVTDLARGVTSRLTFGDWVDGDGTWSPDSQRMAYSSTRKGDKSTYEIAATGGAEQLLFKSIAQNQSVDDWSPDGRFLLFHTDLPRQLWALPMEGDRKPFVIVKPSRGFVDESSVSPNSRWIAYDADESGRYEVYITSFPGAAGRWLVSANGGVQPTWRQDGRELYFLTPDGTLMAVDIGPGSASPEIGTPHALFRTKVVPSGQVDQYAPSPDGGRFLVMNPVDNADQPPTIVVNWPALSKSR